MDPVFCEYQDVYLTPVPDPYEEDYVSACELDDYHADIDLQTSESILEVCGVFG